jgi:hypothetical protein
LFSARLRQLISVVKDGPQNRIQFAHILAHVYPFPFSLPSPSLFFSLSFKPFLGQFGPDSLRQAWRIYTDLALMAIRPERIEPLFSAAGDSPVGQVYCNRLGPALRTWHRLPIHKIWLPFQLNMIRTNDRRTASLSAAYPKLHLFPEFAQLFGFLVRLGDTFR